VEGEEGCEAFYVDEEEDDVRDKPGRRDKISANVREIPFHVHNDVV